MRGVMSSVLLFFSHRTSYWKAGTRTVLKSLVCCLHRTCSTKTENNNKNREFYTVRLTTYLRCDIRTILVIRNTTSGNISLLRYNSLSFPSY